MRQRKLLTAADTSEELRAELKAAMSNPKEIFGYGRYGDGKRWGKLNALTGGLQKLNLTVLASRPKRGKSMLAADWVPDIAEQAREEDKVVRVVTLETRRGAYQRRMAAIKAGIPNPLRIRQGLLSKVEERRYLGALDWLAELPIEYLSNEQDLSEEEAMKFGNSPVTYDEVASFIRGQHKFYANADGKGVPGKGTDTYWWVLDHIGLLNDLSAQGDLTKSIYELANKLAGLAHTVATGMVITHLTRQSVGVMPTIESIAGSDQVGRNADQIFLLSRPYMDVGELSEEDKASIAEGEPAFLQFFSRDEGSGVDLLWWKAGYATFEEMVVPAGVSVPLPSKRKRVA